MSDNFNFKQYLFENKLGAYSKAELNEREASEVASGITLDDEGGLSGNTVDQLWRSYYEPRKEFGAFVGALTRAAMSSIQYDSNHPLRGRSEDEVRAMMYKAALKYEDAKKSMMRGRKGR